MGKYWHINVQNTVITNTVQYPRGSIEKYWPRNHTQQQINIHQHGQTQSLASCSLFMSAKLGVKNSSCWVLYSVSYLEAEIVFMPTDKTGMIIRNNDGRILFQFLDRRILSNQGLHSIQSPWYNLPHCRNRAYSTN